LLCFAFALVFGWSRAAAQLDGQAYDWLFATSQTPGWEAKSALLAIDEASLIEMGGARNLRQTLATILPRVCAAKPVAVAVDLMLSTEEDPKVDTALAEAFGKCPSVVLGADIVRKDSIWEEPIPAFRKASAALGHVHADPDPVSRRIPLEKAVAAKRYWALALEAFRLSKQAGPILETPQDLEVGLTRIPAARETARSVYINYVPASIPQVSLKDVKNKPDSALLFSGKVVFIGYTDQSAARDRLMTPMGSLMTGVEIHANLFETLQQAVFVTDAPVSLPVLLTFAAIAGAGLVFVFLSGMLAWFAAAGWLLLVHLAPSWLFWNQIFLGPSMLLTGVWLATIVSASFHYFVIRRQWMISEADKSRYQQAIHFVTHEMKTPLTAIQGSSEIMSRYKLNEDKQKQFAQMIHSESKRLASMIQTFLDVERLAEGEMELKRDVFPLSGVLLAALDRARVLAERKEMSTQVGAIPHGHIRGDKELLEYAFYNLLNNAVKYSPEHTGIECNCEVADGKVKVSIRDQGMGMDATDLKRIFDRFYRSKRAEESGISGTGIGLSIVNEIVKQHEGRIDVTSEVGVGSVFTVILPFIAGPPLDSDIGNASQRTTTTR
jgi:signal transduction histidine kinase